MQRHMSLVNRPDILYMYLYICQTYTVWYTVASAQVVTGCFSLNITVIQIILPQCNSLLHRLLNKSVKIYLVISAQKNSKAHLTANYGYSMATLPISARSARSKVFWGWASCTVSTLGANQSSYPQAVLKWPIRTAIHSQYFSQSEQLCTFRTLVTNQNSYSQSVL